MIYSDEAVPGIRSPHTDSDIFVYCVDCNQQEISDAGEIQSLTGVKAFSDGRSVDHVASTQTTDDVRIHGLQTHSSLKHISLLLHCTPNYTQGLVLTYTHTHVQL